MAICLEDLIEKKSKFEKEKMFIDAKISVVDEMIADEQAKVVVEEENCETCEEEI